MSIAQVIEISLRSSYAGLCRLCTASLIAGYGQDDESSPSTYFCTMIIGTNLRSVTLSIDDWYRSIGATAEVLRLVLTLRAHSTKNCRLCPLSTHKQDF